MADEIKTPGAEEEYQMCIRDRGHIEQAHLLTAHFLLVDIGQGGICLLYTS